MKLRLTSRIVLVFALLATVLLAVVGVLSYLSGSKSLKDAAVSEMLAAAVEKDAELNGWTDERLANLDHFTGHPDVAEMAASLIASVPAPAEARSALRQELESQISGPHGGFIELLVLEPDGGKVVVSTRPSEEGKSQAARPYFENGKTGLYLSPAYYSADLGSLVITAAAPLRAPDGRVVAVLAAHIDLAVLTEMAQRRTGLRQTMEAFLINAGGFPITQPRFVNERVGLRRQLDTEAVRRCAAGNSGVALAADYRGVPTIAVYRWNARHGFGLVVKIDQAEALAPVRAFGRSLLLVSALALLATVWLALLLARTISRPLCDLHAGVRRVSEGSRLEPVPASAGDEVGLLAREFNQMAARVGERTAELAKANEALLLEIAERKKTESALREQEHLLSESQRLGHIGSWFCTGTGPISWSPELYRLYGVSPDTFTPTVESLPGLIHPEDRAMLQSWIKAAAAGEKPDGYEFRIIRPDGAIRFMRGSGAAVHDAEGRLMHMAGTEQDFTEQQQAGEQIEQSEQRMRAITDSAQDAILMMDREGQVSYWNPAAERIFGFTSAEAIGQDLHNFLALARFHPAHHLAFPGFKQTGQGAAVGKTLDLEARRKDGREISVQLSLSAIQIRDEWHSVGVLRDVTERRQAELRLETFANLGQRLNAAKTPREAAEIIVGRGR